MHTCGKWNSDFFISIMSNFSWNSAMHVSINTGSFYLYNILFVPVSSIVEHMEPVVFICMSICHAQYSVIIIRRHRKVLLETVFKSLLYSWPGMTIFIHWKQQGNTSFHWGSACLLDEKGHIVVLFCVYENHVDPQHY